MDDGYVSEQSESREKTVQGSPKTNNVLSLGNILWIHTVKRCGALIPSKLRVRREEFFSSVSNTVRIIWKIDMSKNQIDEKFH